MIILTKKTRILFEEEYVTGMVHQLTMSVWYHLQRIKEERQDELDITILGIMNGSVFFLSDFAKRFPGLSKIHSVSLSSYKNDEKIKQKPSLIGNLTDLKGGDIIVLDTIIDTGSTLKVVLEELDKVGPRTVTTASVFLKEKSEIKPTFYGTMVPNDHFIYGYGLDSGGLYRNIKGIYLNYYE